LQALVGVNKFSSEMSQRSRYNSCDAWRDDERRE